MIGKLTLFEKSCFSGKEEARTGWSNVDRGPQKIVRKSYSLDQFDSEQRNALRQVGAHEGTRKLH